MRYAAARSSNVCTRCGAALSAGSLRYECANEKCEFYRGRLCPKCTTIEPELGRHIVPVPPHYVEIPRWVCIAMGVTIAVIACVRLGIGAVWGIGVGVVDAASAFLVTKIPFYNDWEDWHLKQHSLATKGLPWTHYSLLRGEYEVVTITEDVPKFAACAACHKPVKLSDGATEQAQAQAWARLHQDV